MIGVNSVPPTPPKLVTVQLVSTRTLVGRYEAFSFGTMRVAKSWRWQLGINATGPYADRVRRLDQPGARSIITPSQGAHVVVDRRFLPGTDALLIPETQDGRIMFAIPWHSKVLLGTTDTPLDHVPTNPVPRATEIATILDVASRYLADSPTEEDVRSIFVGIRPLTRVSGRSTTAKASRKHSIVVDPSGLVSITGGKWTTYRRMAEDCVNIATRGRGFSG